MAAKKKKKKPVKRRKTTTTASGRCYYVITGHVTRSGRTRQVKIKSKLPKKYTAGMVVSALFHSKHSGKLTTTKVCGGSRKQLGVCVKGKGSMYKCTGSEANFGVHTEGYRKRERARHLKEYGR